MISATRFIAAAAAILALTGTSSASLVHFTNKEEWKASVGAYSTITFTDLPPATQVTTQYSEQGIVFTSLNFILHSSAFVNDLFGLHGIVGSRFAFDSPQHWVAIDHPGVAQFQLFFESQLIATSNLFQTGGTGNFSGLVSSIPFDEVYIFKPFPYENQVFIDDLHWGAIPTPGAAAVLALAFLGVKRRRRR